MNDRSKLLIWSKDRACQLHLLLESIDKHLPELFDISVLYTHSNGKFNSGYKILKSHYDNVKWLLEQNFHKDTLGIIKSSNYNCITVTTDDTVIYKTPEVTPLIYLGVGEVFSYRLGLNTIVQNPFDGMLQPEVCGASEYRGIMMWNALLHNPIMNYGYPFGLDMHCWNKNFFLSLIEQFDFNNTSELEGNLFKYREMCPLMFAFKHSVAVNIPFNKLSNTQYIGEQVFYSTDELNDRYLSGQRISLESIEKKTIVGCHQVINLEFRNG
jgi:hypothetical protein